MINDWLKLYSINSVENLLDAKREIMQEITLAGLARTDFFKHATFYGGTALRVFYKINRYSEVLDFSLNNKNAGFDLSNYFSAIQEEFALLGLEVNISIKEKRNFTTIQSAFLKENTIWGLISLNDEVQRMTNFPNIKIKIEIDRDPPLLFDKEEKLLMRPYSFYLSCMTLPSLFAGKMHAVLFREWKSRVKGRDWYDFEWYIKRGVKFKLNQFVDRAINSGHLFENHNYSQDDFLKLLRVRIDQLDIDSAKLDISQFISNPVELNIWSKQYFHDLVDKIQFDS